MFRDVTSLMMKTETVLETSVSFINLMRLIAREDFIESWDDVALSDN
jgi:hypothetical protein